MNEERQFQMKPNNPTNTERNIMVKNIPPDLERSLQLKLGLINCNNEYIAGPPIIKEPPPPRDPNYKPFRCTECNYAAARLGRLNVHKKIHSADRPYKCHSCSYSAKDKSNLRKHIRIHTGDKLFKCNSCSYMSTQFSHMNIHQRIHTGVKPFKCSRCNYAATDKSNLKRHERIHSCDRPYKCMYCNYSAVQIGSLRRHSKIHKQMKCTHCDYTTADASYLKLHEMTHNSTADNVDLNVPNCDDMHVVEPCSTSTQTDKRHEPEYPDHDNTCTSIATSDELTNHSKSDMGCSPSDMGCSPSDMGCSPSDMGCSPPDTQDYM